MIPVRTVAPADPIVTLSDLKLHLRIDYDDDDALIGSYLAAAAAWLDGYRGVLGRCVMPQTWQVVYGAAGTYRLPFPDVQTVTASAGTATLSSDCLGPLVTVTEAATVTMTVQCAPDILASVQQIVRLLVAHWFQNREAVSDGTMSEIPLSVDALLAPIRWVRV